MESIESQPLKSSSIQDPKPILLEIAAHQHVCKFRLVTVLVRIKKPFWWIEVFSLFLELAHATNLLPGSFSKTFLQGLVGK